MTDPPGPRLLVLRGDQVLAEHRLPAGAELLVGRAPQCQVAIDDGTVSRLHLRLFARGPGVFLEDLGSANGTFVDDRKVSEVVQLADGQLVRAGQKAVAQPIVLRFEDPAGRVEPTVQLGARQAGSAAAPALPAHPALTVAYRPEPAPPTAPGRARPPAVAPATWPVPAPPRRDSAPPPPPPRPLHQPSSPGGPPPESGAEPPPPAAAVATPLPPPVRAGRGGLWALLTAAVTCLLLVMAALVLAYLRLSRPASTGQQQVAPPPSADAAVPLRITRLEPAALRAGEELTLFASGLAAGREPPEVRIGGQSATLLEVTPDRLRVRVPAVGGAAAEQLPVVVRVDGREARASQLLRIVPGPAVPLELLFTAAHRGAGMWELASPLGPLFLLAAGPPGPDGLPPSTVREVQEGLTRLVAEATRDPGLRVEATAIDGGFALVAASPGRPPWPVVRWSEAELRATARSRQVDSSPERLADWMATVWNHLLAALARGETPELAASPPPHLHALVRLLEIHRAAGGGGRPAAADLERLGSAEREALALAFFAVPSRHGSLAGGWTARLQNLFYPEDDYAVTLGLQLQQRGNALAGHGEVQVEGQALSFAVPPAAVRGAVVRPGPTPQIELHLSFGRPIGELRLQGVLEGEALSGTYRSSLASGEGTWQAVRR